MSTRRQEERLAEAWEVLGRQATARQIFRYLDRKYPHSSGFKSPVAVGKLIKAVKRRRGTSSV